MIAFLLLLALSALSSVSAGHCMGDGYDLTLLTYTDMTYTSGTTQIYYRPCSNVTAAACAGIVSTNGGSMVCSYDTSTSTATDLAVWRPNSEQTVAWTPIRNGVSMTLADSALGRTMMINYYCNRFYPTGLANITGYAADSPTSFRLNITTAAVCTGVSNACGALGFDLSPIASTDLILLDPVGNFTYYYRPCGVVSAPQCSRIDADMMMCMVAGQQQFGAVTDVAVWDSSLASYTRNADGLSMFIEDGSTCNGVARSLTVNYVCDTTASTPLFASMTQPSNCFHVATVRTISVCNPQNATSAPVTCGGPYNLNALSQRDIVYNVGNWNYVLRPCSVVTNAVCAAYSGTVGSMLCQAATAGTSTHNIATYVSSGVSYQPIRNGVRMMIQDGEYCSAASMNRKLTIDFQCQPGLFGQAVFASFSEKTTCDYWATVNTSLVCPGTPRGCGINGYDFSISGQDLQYVSDDGGYKFVFRPCGVVLDPECNTESGTAGASMMCQVSYGYSATYDIAFYDSNLVAWRMINGGVQMFVQDGTTCGTLERALTVNFLCDPTLTSPWFKNITEPTICNYVAFVYTPQACANLRTSSTGIAVSYSTGGQYYYKEAAHCGGPYDLSSLTQQEMIFTNSTTGFTYYVNPCGVVSNPTCRAITNADNNHPMVCQITSTGAHSLMTYDPFQTSYSIRRNGVMQSSQDGELCGTAARISNVYYFCDPNATRPSIDYVFENPQCTYNIRVRTNLTCPTAAITCGGAGYNISSLSAGPDLQWVTSSYVYYFQPCKPVSASVCNLNDNTAGISSLCQNYVGSNSTTDVAPYLPQQTLWTPYNSGGQRGVTMSLQAGESCGDFLRYLTVNFICRETAVTANNSLPSITSFSEPTICHYVMNVDIAKTCDAFIPSTPSSSSSSSSSTLSGGAIAGVVIGCVVGAILLALCVFCILCAGGKTASRGGKDGKFSSHVDSSNDVEMSQTSS